MSLENEGPFNIMMLKICMISWGNRCTLYQRAFQSDFMLIKFMWIIYGGIASSFWGLVTLLDQR